MAISSKSTPHALLKTFDFLHMPAFLIDGDGIILDQNAAAAEVLQHSSDEISGRSLSDLCIPADQAQKGSSLATQPWKQAQDLYAKQNSNVSEYLCKKSNGDTFSARLFLIPTDGPVQKIALLEDISDWKKLSRKSSQRTKELSIFNDFARILTGMTHIESIFSETVEMLCTNMEADAGWIYLFDERNHSLHLKAQKGFPADFAEQVKQMVPGECFNGKVFKSGRPLLVEQTSKDPRICRRDLKVESLAGVPLTSRGVVFGVLGVGSVHESFFSSMDIQLLTTVGSQLGVAVENARLIDQLHDKMKQIELINELSGIVNSSLSIGTIFRIMVSEIRKLIDYSRASLLLYSEKDDSLLIFALDTDLKTNFKKGTRAPLEGTSAGWVVRNNKPWITEDLAQTSFRLDRKLHEEGLRSTISVPLYHDRILGVFNFDSTEPGKYSEKDLEILLPVAKHISIALENALLFEQISKEKKEWKKTFDAITDLVWIEDGQQRVIRANHALLRRIGLAPVEIAGKECFEILDRIGITFTECLCTETRFSRMPSFRELRGSGGTIFHFWAYPLLDDDGNLYAVVHYLKDVTARRHLEQQLIRSDRLASLGTLVAGIAHEINNPLGIIAGYSEALLDRAQDESLRWSPAFEDFPEYLETIHSEIFRSKDILSSLLAFARPSGKIFREIDINELIKEVILLVKHKASRLNHELALELNRDLPKVWAEPGSLRQLFMNIIINSMYFTPEGGRITITSVLDEASEPPVIEVSISDTGPGIGEDIIGKIFDPFFTTKPVGEGTGLGLSICHKITEEHGGTIDVKSSPGKGSNFMIRLPGKR